MMSKKIQGELLRVGAVALWILLVFLWVQFELWYILLLLFVAHFIEAVTIGLSKGRVAGYSPTDSFTFTLVFGFTWWRYLHDLSLSKNKAMDRI